MLDSHLLCFGPYQLDLKQEQFWSDGQPVHLPPKVFQVLHYLAERPGQLVTKEELFRVVWADTVVGDAALTMCIQEIRKALADNAREPQYIETVPRRGFRFIGKVVGDQWSVVSQDNVVSSQHSVVRREEGQTGNCEDDLAASVQSLESEEQKPVMTDLTLGPKLSDSRLSDPKHQTLQDSAPARFWSRKVFLLPVTVLLIGTVL